MYVDFLMNSGKKLQRNNWILFINFVFISSGQNRVNLDDKKGVKKQSMKVQEDHR